MGIFRMSLLLLLINNICMGSLRGDAFLYSEGLILTPDETTKRGAYYFDVEASIQNTVGFRVLFKIQTNSSGTNKGSGLAVVMLPGPASVRVLGPGGASKGIPEAAKDYAVSLSWDLGGDFIKVQKGRNGPSTPTNISCLSQEQYNFALTYNHPTTTVTVDLGSWSGTFPDWKLYPDNATQLWFGVTAATSNDTSGPHQQHYVAGLTHGNLFPAVTTKATSGSPTTQDATTGIASTGSPTTQDATTGIVSTGSPTTRDATTGIVSAGTVVSYYATNYTVSIGNVKLKSNQTAIEELLQQECGAEVTNCENTIECEPTSSNFSAVFYVPYDYSQFGFWKLKVTFAGEFGTTTIWNFWLIHQNGTYIRFATSQGAANFEWSTRSVEGNTTTKRDLSSGINIEDFVVNNLIGVAISSETADTSLYIDEITLETCYGTRSECFPPAEVSEEDTGRSVLAVAIAVPIVLCVLIAAVIVAVILIRRRKPQRRSTLKMTDVEMQHANTPEIKEVIIGEHLGAGNFGDVYKGMAWGTTPIALKKLRNELAAEFVAESTILAKVKHPNCVLFLGIYNGPKTHDRYLATEFCENGSLLDWMQKHEKLKITDLLSLCLDAIRGMVYLESQNIVHRDLGARNLLVDSKGTVKVADFGLSRAVENFYESTNATFAVKWSAPEVIRFGRFSSKSDIWSMGITMYEIVTIGGTPYVGMSNQEVINRITDDQYRIEKPGSVASIIWQIISGCWNEVPGHRPSFLDLSQQLEAVIDQLAILHP